jgi:hypothetical protein
MARKKDEDAAVVVTDEKGAKDMPTSDPNATEGGQAERKLPEARVGDISDESKPTVS